jgi:integrase/recombinase XerD
VENPSANTKGLPARSKRMPSRCEVSFKSDQWEAQSLGIEPDTVHGQWTFYFQDIEPVWLKDLTKKLVQYSASSRRFHTLAAYVKNVKTFSKFLADKGYYPKENEIDRDLIVEYISFLSSSGLGWVTRHQALSHLRLLFETCAMNEWLELPPFLIRTEDFPRSEHTVPRFIPEEVLRSLDRNIDKLPPPVMRMVLIFKGAGLRFAELAKLPLHCIEQDGRGDWFLRFMNFKMRSEQVKPISQIVAGAIQEQQEFIEENIRRHLDPQYQYLFCSVRRGSNSLQPKVMNIKQFHRHLNGLAEEVGITDVGGNLWHFESHQFRHTLGTTLINSNVPLHIIQRYLGHKSPEMTLRYAYIHDETMKRELRDYLASPIVNVEGELMDGSRSHLDGDVELQFLKKNILAQALPNGSCARPIAKGPCPHANACLTCGDFRTGSEFLTKHHEQLLNTERIIEEAERLGYSRQAEMNKQVRSNLLKIITTLEEAREKA